MSLKVHTRSVHRHTSTLDDIFPSHALLFVLPGSISSGLTSWNIWERSSA
jgi:hypothetical protein